MHAQRSDSWANAGGVAVGPSRPGPRRSVAVSVSHGGLASPRVLRRVGSGDAERSTPLAQRGALRAVPAVASSASGGSQCVSRKLWVKGRELGEQSPQHADKNQVVPFHPYR